MEHLVINQCILNRLEMRVFFLVFISLLLFLSWIICRIEDS